MILFFKVDMDLNDWSFGQIIHEIFHALGRPHEHNRPDSDQYVYVDPEWRKGEIPGYEIQEKIDTYGIPYEYRSTMHYPSGNKEKFHAIQNSNLTNNFYDTISATFRDILWVNRAICNKVIN